MLKNKKILLGITGSIAAYKAADLARRLTESGACVNAVMTEASRKFITPLTFETVTGNRVYSDIFEDPLSHIDAAGAADLMVVAPATANTIARFANGIADDMLSACFMAFRGKVIIAPAMNWRMYESPALRRNLNLLLSSGVIQTGPEKGSLACGDEAIGRMSEAHEIIEEIKTAFSPKDLTGTRIVVTAGPTRESIDPVRFISNRSSGKMGYAIAKAALRRGSDVVLISGPSLLAPPKKAVFFPVETAREMRDAVVNNLDNCSALIMTAAVADFSPEKKSGLKIEKSGSLTLNLKKTPDILSEVGSMRRKPLLVGFAAEAGRNIEQAREKLLSKKVDIGVYNNVMSAGSGFDVDTNEITIIEKKGHKSFPLMTKDEAAGILLDRIARLLQK